MTIYTKAVSRNPEIACRDVTELFKTRHNNKISLRPLPDRRQTFLRTLLTIYANGDPQTLPISTLTKTYSESDASAFAEGFRRPKLNFVEAGR